jgi:CDP-paratose 2-epimerase
VVRFADWRPADQKVYISDIAKAEEKLGWKPEVGPWEGLKRIIRWFTQDYKAVARFRARR